MRTWEGAAPRGLSSGFGGPLACFVVFRERNEGQGTHVTVRAQPSRADGQGRLERKVNEGHPLNDFTDLEQLAER